MDGLTLLSDAAAAGLTVWADGDRLVIRGPRAAEAVARRLLEHKPEVVAALEAEPERPTIRAVVRSTEAPPLGADGWPADTIEPGEPCPRCGSLEKWWDFWGGEHCQQCEADQLERARGLVERAAELRRRTPPRQNRAPDVVPVASEPAGPTQNSLEASGDSRGSYRAFHGCQSG